MSLKIGITERGDAGINLTWEDKLSTVDGAILITKKITEEFSEALLHHHNNGFPIILHATCTGWGGSDFEPNVPEPRQQLTAAYRLLEKGFPLKRLVLRIDPIIPTSVGMKKFSDVLQIASEIGIPIQTIRKRISILDQYPHVKKRLESIGYQPLYNGYFQAAPWAIETIAKKLDTIYNQWGKYAIGFESCAEPKLAEQAKSVTASGCVSTKDIELMGLNPTKIPNGINGQNRKGCLCCMAKKELLTQKSRCANGCIYCYWKG